MKTNAPKKITWLIALIIGALGIVGQYVTIPFVSDHGFWFVTAGFVILVLATLLKDL